MRDIARNSIIVTVFNTIGTIAVFLSNIVIAYKFGAGKDMDVYFASTALPLFIMTILSTTLSFTFIPIFSEYEKKATKDKWKIVSSFINFSLILAVLLCMSGMVFSEKIMTLITPGFSQAKIQEAAVLMRLLFPTLIFSALNELVASVYYSHNRFVIPSLNKVLNPVITIVYVMLFGSFLSTKSLVLAILSAYFIQNVVLVIGFLRHRDFDYTFSMNFRHPEVIRIFKLMTPLIAAMLITKAMPITDRFFLSRLEEGNISHVAYAHRITLHIIDTAATGLIVALFPVMSAHAASTEYDKLYRYMMKGTKMLFFITIPFVAIFFLHGKLLVKFLFERGMFTPSDTHATFSAFSLYLLSLPAVAIGGVLYKGFYSIQMNKTVAIVSVLIMFFYIGLCAIFINFFNYRAIPLSHVIAFNISVIVSGLLIRRYLGIKGSLGVLSEICKSGVAAAASALSIRPLMGFAASNIILYSMLCAMGFLLYFVIAKGLFRLEAPAIVWNYISEIGHRHKHKRNIEQYI